MENALDYANVSSDFALLDPVGLTFSLRLLPCLFAVPRTKQPSKLVSNYQAADRTWYEQSRCRDLAP